MIQNSKKLLSIRDYINIKPIKQWLATFSPFNTDNCKIYLFIDKCSEPINTLNQMCGHKK